MAGGALSFREDPFRLTPDRRYIVETDGFRRAFAMLLAGVRARRGAMLLTGPSGTGKTTLLQGLLGKLQQDGATVFWRFHPDIPGYDLIGSCLAELEIEDTPADPTGCAQALAKALKVRSPSLASVLIVDEADQFSDAQLAEIVALPAATGGAMQVVLAGLPAVAERLDGEEPFTLKDAIALRAELGPLGRNELGTYIAHRCRVAGQAGPLVFEPAAIARVFHHTGGTPRLVNRLCATALFFAPAGAKQIAAAVVDEAARACAGEPPAGEVQISETAGPQAVNEPDASASAPEHHAPRGAPSEVHRALAEAERAWISGGAMQPAARPEASAPGFEQPEAGELVPPSAPSIELRVSEPIVSAVAVATPNAPIVADEITQRIKVSPVRRRSRTLRIAASVVVIAGSATALAAAFWPTGIDHDYLADSPPAKAVARLLVAEDTALKPVPAPAAVAGEAALPPEPPPQMAIVVSAAPVEAMPEPTVSPPAPTEGVAEAVAAKPEPATPEPVIAEPPPEPELPSAANTAPKIEEPTAPSSETPSAEIGPQPAPPAPVPASKPPADTASLVLESPASEVMTDTASLSEIAPANGPANVPGTTKEEPGADPADSPKSEAAAPVVAATFAQNPDTSTAAPAAKPPEPPVAALIPPPPVPSAPRMAQASAPAADPAELERLMARGDEMMRLGDPASARLFYERAAARGLARAYTAVGRTYDPLALQRLNIRGGGANGEHALSWYRRGADAGDKDAAAATSDLTAWLARPR